jgi:major membrane immunogen (membrane-anchored lipoprotein)
MYIIRLDAESGDMFKVLYDYEGFKGTLKIEEATKFKTLDEAKDVLESMSIRKVYQAAHIERIK